LCGEGELVVNYCTPDHPFANSDAYHWELFLECDICNGEYVFIDQDQQAVIASRTEIAARQTARQEYLERSRALMSRDDVRAYLSQLIALVISQPSAAAKHRVFTRAGMTVDSEATFRRSLKAVGDERIVQQSAAPHNLSRIMTILEVKNEEISNELEVLKALELKSKEPCRPVIDPVCVLTKEAFYNS